MAKRKSQTKKVNRPSTSQIIFVVLTLVIILSFILSLFVKL
ncbi:MAG TPA: hypothetical protein VLX61_14300 [Anaerolineales bacterium]|nr:hypothetical protein [Anaerolineales bacterium]